MVQVAVVEGQTSKPRQNINYQRSCTHQSPKQQQMIMLGRNSPRTPKIRCRSEKTMPLNSSRNCFIRSNPREISEQKQIDEFMDRVIQKNTASFLKSKQEELAKRIQLKFALLTQPPEPELSPLMTPPSQKNRLTKLKSHFLITPETPSRDASDEQQHNQQARIITNTNRNLLLKFAERTRPKNASLSIAQRMKLRMALNPIVNPQVESDSLKAVEKILCKNEDFASKIAKDTRSIFIKKMKAEEIRLKEQIKQTVRCFISTPRSLSQLVLTPKRSGHAPLW